MPRLIIAVADTADAEFDGKNYDYGGDDRCLLNKIPHKFACIHLQYSASIVRWQSAIYGADQLRYWRAATATAQHPILRTSPKLHTAEWCLSLWARGVRDKFVSTLQLTSFALLEEENNKVHVMRVQLRERVLIRCLQSAIDISVRTLSTLIFP